MLQKCLHWGFIWALRLSGNPADPWHRQGPVPERQGWAVSSGKDGERSLWRGACAGIWLLLSASLVPGWATFSPAHTKASTSMAGGCVSPELSESILQQQLLLLMLAIRLGPDQCTSVLIKGREIKNKKEIQEDWMCLVCNLLGVYFLQFGNCSTLPIRS